MRRSRGAPVENDTPIVIGLIAQASVHLWCKLWRDTVAAQGSDRERAALHQIKYGAITPRNRLLDFAQVHGGETPHVSATHDESAHVNGIKGIGEVAMYRRARRAQQDNLSVEGRGADAIHKDGGVASSVYRDARAFTAREFVYSGDLLFRRNIDDSVNAAPFGKLTAGGDGIEGNDARAHELVELGGKIANEAQAENGDGIVEIELRDARGDHGNFCEGYKDSVFRGNAVWNRIEAAPLVGLAVQEALSGAMLTGVEDADAGCEI